MLLHIDGSRHRWLQDERWYELLAILDDATSEIYDAQLVEEESTRTVLALLSQGVGGRAGIREVVERKGVFCAMYPARRDQPFLCDAQSRGAGGSDSADAGGPGAAGPGNGTDPSLLAAGAGAQRTKLPHVAGATASGAASASDSRTARGQ